MDKNAQALSDYMNMLAAQAYAGGRLQHLEYVLWHALVTGPLQYGRLAITEQHIRELRDLSYQCEGWIVFDEGGGGAWEPLAGWQDMYTRKVDRVTFG